MSVQIPVNGSSLPTPAAGRVTIPIGLKLGIPLLGAGREDKVVRAVAGAAALQEPSAALRLARQAVDDPASVAGNVIDRSKLDPVLALVSAAIDQGGGSAATAEQSAAARVVG